MKADLFLCGLKGLFVGGTMLVPGVSGGSMAIILGVYDRLVTSVSSFMKHKRKSAIFLGIFALGALLGMFLFAKPLLSIIEKFTLPAMYFFIGAVAGGVPMIIRKAEINKVSWRVFVYPILGFLIILLFSFLPENIFRSDNSQGWLSYLLLLIAGIIAAVALVLPGISVSYMLLLMGMYDETMKAIGELYFPYLLPLGIGLIVGIILTTKLLEKAMVNHPQPTYLIILGFIVGSVVEVFPGIPMGWNIPLCIALFLAGFVIIQLLSKLESKKETE